MHADITQRSGLHRGLLQNLALTALPMTELRSLRGTLRTFALSGWHSLLMPLHQSRRREAERVLQRHRDLIIRARADRDGSFIR